MTERTPVQIIQAFQDAFNAHDLAGMLDLVSRDVVVRSDDYVDTGNDYALYADLLHHQITRNPKIKSELLDRMSLGNVVIDEVVLSGLLYGSGHTITIYEITGELITSVRIIAE